MQLILGVIGLFLEALYYSLFIKNIKKESNIIKLIILFILINIFFAFVGSNILFSYLLLMIIIVLGLKYFANIKINNYDMFFLFIMMAFKIIVEGFSVTIISLLIRNNYFMAISLSFIKLLALFLFKNKLNLLYNKFKKHWDNNIFYIRYAFAILMLIYVISSCCFLIFNR